MPLLRTLTKEQEDLRDGIALKNGLQGAAVGLGLGVAATMFVLKRSPNFRALSLPMRSVLAVTGTATGYMFCYERAVSSFENKVLGYVGDDLMETQRAMAAISNRSHMSTKDRFLYAMNENRWTIIGASWAVSMVGALGISFSNRYLTTQQKLVQARMYAQAVTIAVLMASAGLSIYIGEEHTKKKEVDPQLQAILDLPNSSTTNESATPSHAH